MTRPPGYRLISVYARDTTGIYYRAKQTKLARSVTVKSLRVELAERPRAREIFLAERELATGLEQPNLLLVLDTGETDGIPWFVTESTDETTLADVLAEGEPLAEIRAVAIALGIARALRYLASRDLVYKNIHPRQVLLPRPARPKLLTFRHVKPLEVAQSFRGANVQSGIYCAPELVRDDLGPVTPRTNVYALGGLLFHMFAGVPPVEGDSAAARAAHAVGHVRSLQETRPFVRDRADRIVRRTMCQDPRQRADAAETARLLEEYLNDPLVTRPPTKKKKRRRRR